VKVVVGVDGGGTFTRAMCAALDGTVLGYAEAGGAHPGKNADAADNVRRAIGGALGEAERGAGDVAAIVAGIAGFNHPDVDARWADAFTDLPGLKGGVPRRHVNDAVVAHAGAFGAQRAGIVVIAGTGSIVFGVTPAGRHVRNYDFNHFGRSTARDLGYAAVYRILAGDWDPASDRPLVDAVLGAWRADDVPALCALAGQSHAENPQDVMRRFGALAPLVTRAALDGVPLGQRICDTVAGELEMAVRIVGACFANESGPPAPNNGGERRGGDSGSEVLVALVGSVVNSSYVAQALRHALAATPPATPELRYVVVPPAFSSVAGAVLMALNAAAIAVGAEASSPVRVNLARHAKAGAGE